MRRFSMVLLLVVLALSAFLAPVASAKLSRQERAVRRVAQGYLDALARGDARSVCRLLSPKGRADGGAHSLRQCERITRRDLRGFPHGRFPQFHVITVSVDGRDADALIDDAKISDSGNDAIGLHRYRSGWLIDAG